MITKENDYDHFSLTENQGQNIDGKDVDDVSNRNICTRQNISYAFALEEWYLGWSVPE